MGGAGKIVRSINGSEAIQDTPLHGGLSAGIEKQIGYITGRVVKIYSLDEEITPDSFEEYIENMYNLLKDLIASSGRTSLTENIFSHIRFTILRCIIKKGISSLEEAKDLRVMEEASILYRLVYGEDTNGNEAFDKFISRYFSYYIVDDEELGPFGRALSDRVGELVDLVENDANLDIIHFNTRLEKLMF